MTDFKTTSALLLSFVCWGSRAAAQLPGTFAPTGSMITPRFGHTATLLYNGKVLIAGGRQRRALRSLYRNIHRNRETRLHRASP
jgi:hypothetical protein